MPNWCYNHLKIEGDEKQIKEFKTQAKQPDMKDREETDLSFQNFFPCPQELSDTQSPCNDEKQVAKNVIKYGFKDWYDWRVANWGVNWEVNAGIGKDEKNLLTYQFDSPWCSPTKFFAKVSRLFPDLTFSITYEEPGMCFEGEFIVKNGEISLDRCDDMSFTHCPECDEDFYEDECPQCGYSE